MRLLKYYICFILIIACCMLVGCDFTGKNAVKFEDHDRYLWNGDIAFEPVDTVMPIKIDKAFGYGYIGTISGKCKMHELDGQNRNEWFYMRYPSVLPMPGQLYKAVSIATPTIATFGVTSIEIRGTGINTGKIISTISDKTVINKVTDILASTGAKPFFDIPMTTANSRFVMLFSSNYPGLFYISNFEQDESGRGYLSKLDLGTYGYEIGDMLNSYYKGVS